MKSLDDIEALLLNQGSAPPIEKWQPELSGDIDIRIHSDGSWFHEGSEIRRFELVKLFASILRREDDGHYYLVTPVEKWRIQVEDLPLLIVDMEVSAGSPPDKIAVKTNVGNWFELNASHPLNVFYEQGSDEPQPEVRLKHGLAGRVNRACFFGGLGARARGQACTRGGRPAIRVGPNLIPVQYHRHRFQCNTLCPSPVKLRAPTKRNHKKGQCQSTLPFALDLDFS